MIASSATRETQLSPELRKALTTTQLILDLKPTRLVRLASLHPRRLTGASDAGEEAPRKGSGGFLLVGPTEDRLGAVVPITPEVFDLW